MGFIADMIKGYVKKIEEVNKQVAFLTSEEAHNQYTEETKKSIGSVQPHQYVSPYPRLFGSMHATVGSLSLMPQHLTNRIEEIEPLERLGSIAEELDIETEDLKFLELLVSEERYRLDRNELREAIRKVINEVKDTEAEEEYQDALGKLEEAGFKYSENDDYWWRYNGPEVGSQQFETVSIRTKKSTYDWYFSINDEPRGHGSTGEFSKLLEAVGVATPTAA